MTVIIITTVRHRFKSCIDRLTLVDVPDDDDVPDNEAEYLEFLQKKKMQRQGADEDDEEDDDEDWCEELGEQLYYETPLDHINVYQQFQELFHQLSQHRQDVYGALVAQLNKDQEQQIQQILAKANEPATEAKKDKK